MDINKIMLIIIRAMTQSTKHKPGRTLLQKFGYFVLDHIGYKLIYTSYYYGPYSSEIEQSVHDLESLGLIDESCELLPEYDTIEHVGRKYQYGLTQKGKKIAAEIIRKNDVEFKKIEEVVNNLIQANGRRTPLISDAAKLHYIMQMNNQIKKHDIDGLRNYAKEYGWTIKPESVNRAIKFLEESGFLN